MKVLVVEDNPRVSQFLRKGLEESGHVVDCADNGQDGLFLATSGRYDVIVLDRMLPGGPDGLTIVQTLRREKNRTPILILSALAEVDDRIMGLRAGGDDYLTKPFSFGELSARIDALVRRSLAGGGASELVVGDLHMDLRNHDVTRAGRRIELKPREFKLLEYLMRHSGQVVTRNMLLENVWDYRFEPRPNVIDTHISNLRRKIDVGSDSSLLHTVRGFGYRLGENA